MRAALRSARGIGLLTLALSSLMACDFGSWGDAERCTPGRERTTTGWFGGPSYRERCGDDGRWYGYSDYSHSGSSSGDGGATNKSTVSASEAGATPSCCSLRVVGPSSVEYDMIGNRAGTYEARAMLQPGAAPDGGEPEPAVVFGEAEDGDASVVDGWVAYCLPGKLRVDVSTANGLETVDADASCDDGKFHHVVVTFDAVTTLFFDGVRVGEGAFVPPVKARTLHLGSIPWWKTTSVTTLDEIAVWDGTGPLQIRSKWSFDECSGTKAHGNNVYGGAVSVDVDASMWVAACRP